MLCLTHKISDTFPFIAPSGPVCSSGQQIILEVKSVEQFASIHHKQILNDMRVAGLRAGLLINFNVPILPDRLCRKVL
jgi:GxxExxY protein